MPEVAWEGYISFGLVSFPVRVFATGQTVPVRDVANESEYLAEDDEPGAIASANATSMDVVWFVNESEVDPIFFERSYYVAPGENLTSPYALFVKALKETASSAIARLSFHNSERLALIRSSGDALVLHTLFGGFSDSPVGVTVPVH
jgi:DNA end-binding protein Ku